MKPLSPRAQKALLDYRREHALPTSVRTRLLAEVVQRSQRAEDQEPELLQRQARPARASLRLVRWVAPAALILGIGLWLRPGSPALQSAEVPQVVSPSRHGPAAAELPVPEAETLPRSTPPAASRVSARPRSVERVRAARIAPKQAAQADARNHALLPVATSPVSIEERAAMANQEPTVASRVESSAPPAFRVSSQTSAPSAMSGIASATHADEEPRRRPSLDEEVMQMRTAYDQLRAGEPLRALSSLAEHAQRFPDGKLTTMRKVARIQALCDLGRRSAASEEAARFLEEHGDSPYAPRIRQVCVSRSPGAR